MARQRDRQAHLAHRRLGPRSAGCAPPSPSPKRQLGAGHNDARSSHLPRSQDSTWQASAAAEGASNITIVFFLLLFIGFNAMMYTLNLYKGRRGTSLAPLSLIRFYSAGSVALRSQEPAAPAALDLAYEGRANQPPQEAPRGPTQRRSTAFQGLTRCFGVAR